MQQRQRERPEQQRAQQRQRPEQREQQRQQPEQREQQQAQRLPEQEREQQQRALQREQQLLLFCHKRSWKQPAEQPGERNISFDFPFRTNIKTHTRDRSGT